MSYAISNLHCVPKGFSIGSFVEIYTTKCNYLAMVDTRILVEIVLVTNYRQHLGWLKRSIQQGLVPLGIEFRPPI